MKYQSAITQVFIDLAAHQKLWAWTRMAKGEVSILGLVEETPGGPAITDLFLMRQTCTSATTDMDQADVARLLFDLGSAGIEGQLRAWIHSHASMDVFWSRTDEDCIEGLHGDPYTVSVVVNRKGDVRARVDVFQPVRFVIDELPLQLRVPDLGLEESCKAEFMTKVNEMPTFPALGLRPGCLVPPGPLFAGGPDLFGERGHHRQFAMLDLDELEAAVHRGEMTMQEYFEAVDASGYADGFVDQDSLGEVNDARRP